MDACEDQLSKESGRMKLSDLNDSWSDCLKHLSDREDMLKRGLELAALQEGEERGKRHEM